MLDSDCLKVQQVTQPGCIVANKDGRLNLLVAAKTNKKKSKSLNSDTSLSLSKSRFDLGFKFRFVH